MGAYFYYYLFCNSITPWKREQRKERGERLALGKCFIAQFHTYTSFLELFCSLTAVVGSNHSFEYKAQKMGRQMALKVGLSLLCHYTSVNFYWLFL